MGDMAQEIGELRGFLSALQETQRLQIDTIMERIEMHEKRLDDRLTRLEANIAARRQRDHEMNGAMWALSLVGGAVLTGLTALGYMAVHGVPGWAKRLFDYIQTPPGN